MFEISDKRTSVAITNKSMKSINSLALFYPVFSCFLNELTRKKQKTNSKFSGSLFCDCTQQDYFVTIFMLTAITFKIRSCV